MHQKSGRINNLFDTLGKGATIIEKKLMAAYLEIINGHWEASV